MEAMKKILLVVMVLGIGINADAQYKVVTDTKTAKQVASNQAVAVGNETLYENEIKETKDSRQKLLSKVTVRNLMKSTDMIARKGLGNLNREGAAYAAMCHEVSRLTKSISRLMSAASDRPGNMIYCVKAAGKVTAEARGLVEQTIAVAMNGKVPNPFNFNPDSLKNGNFVNTKSFEQEQALLSPSERKNDGNNLLLSDERLRICNNTVFGLRRLRRSVDIITFKLRCNYTWRDIWMNSTLGYEYYWMTGMQTKLTQMKYQLNNPPWKK